MPKSMLVSTSVQDQLTMEGSLPVILAKLVLFTIVVSNYFKIVPALCISAKAKAEVQIEM